ncbi:hypothetical protein MKS88_003819 [Plasmodium brasilianum]|uniref:Uncharacterized protein n=2 Tax=Plasmodium (Plasmodium) TaxID=418103 RepID=A0A1A8W6H8_PLAMA|nr:conserved Plasmodium protein, unknown function [Plasmodium malariae]KAI4837348.1 hypothetical protein MKS88_003819 [Plasmodium brasilianum]SBS87283.1 conserved Plasmodium protein, unknown function [Plasmodium malariae]SCO93229.1 conserved Plasmodium protein, unknown function [Plasmodium malariae]
MKKEKIESDLLFKVPRYIPEGDLNNNEFSKINNVERGSGNEKHVMTKKLNKNKEGGTSEYRSEAHYNEEDSKNLNNDNLEISEQIWFNNLLKKKNEQVEATHLFESESDEEVIINADNIFKNIYPFFKTDEDPDYIKQKNELQRFIKYKT